ncbi:hypothetical protein F4678DRAFT_244441 [Xylaria arbuscula]|nr:hypothetical protein F4678DRAFT_244441 [Xylaria arbuscula]
MTVLRPNAIPRALVSVQCKPWTSSPMTTTQAQCNKQGYRWPNVVSTSAGSPANALEFLKPALRKSHARIASCSCYNGRSAPPRFGVSGHGMCLVYWWLFIQVLENTYSKCCCKHLGVVLDSISGTPVVTCCWLPIRYYKFQASHRRTELKSATHMRFIRHPAGSRQTACSRPCS